jgi:hypothetical protein
MANNQNELILWSDPAKNREDVFHPDGRVTYAGQKIKRVYDSFMARGTCIVVFRKENNVWVFKGYVTDDVTLVRARSTAHPPMWEFTLCRPNIMTRDVPDYIAAEYDKYATHLKLKALHRHNMFDLLADRIPCTVINALCTGMSFRSELAY